MKQRIWVVGLLSSLCITSLWGVASCSHQTAAVDARYAEQIQQRDDELASLRAEVAALHAELARARVSFGTEPSTPPQLTKKAVSAVASHPATVQSGNTANVTSISEQDEEYLEHLAAVERRFGKLHTMLQSQSRDETWAKKHESHFLALPSSHEYFARTKIVEVECRSSWCRVVTEHADENDQGMFEEVVPGFSGGFAWSTMRSVPNSDPPRTEVYFALEKAGPLPR